MHDWLAFTVYSLYANKNMNKIYTAIHRKTIKIVSKNIKRQAHV